VISAADFETAKTKLLSQSPTGTMNPS